jgi:electron transfer flavoprotein alpha subunit
LAVKGDVWVFSEKADLLAELIAGAHELSAHSGGSVVAVVLGARDEADKALARGAQHVLWLGERKEGYLVDDYVPAVVKLLEESHPAVLLVGATRVGRAAAARLAAHLNTTALTDVMEFFFEDESLLVRHMIFGGGAVRVDKALGDIVIATAGYGVFEPQALAEQRGEVVEVPFIEPEKRAILVERKPRQVAAVNLGAARRVVCAGRGVGKQEDLQIVEELSRALGAEMACTRPLAEGLDWMPRERYIGISGAMIKPELYLGVGVSGQAQHAIGMSESRVVVAINKDSSAPIISQADYWIEEDLYAVVPALLEALRKRT